MTPVWFAERDLGLPRIPGTLADMTDEPVKNPWTNFQNLGWSMHTRRDRAGVTREQVAEWGGPSTTTQTRLEKARGSEPDYKMQQKIDAGYGWEPGSAARCLAGKSPIELEDWPPVGVVEITKETIRQIGGPRVEQNLAGVDLHKIFFEWADITMPQFHLEMRYATLRGFPNEPGRAHQELWAALLDYEDARKSNRPWIPPWRPQPAAEDLADDEVDVGALLQDAARDEPEQVKDGDRVQHSEE